MFSSKKFFLIIFFSITSLFLYLNLNRDSQVDQNNTVTIGSSVIKVTVAETNEEKAQGLSGKVSLGESEGMLFDYSASPQPTIFWMKGMLMPIDIIWIRDNRIIKIDKQVQPAPENTPDQNLTHYPSPGFIEYVLEVSAGLSENEGIEVGDKVEIKIAKY